MSSVIATVEDGKILLPPDLHWPAGAAVRVELLPAHDLGDLLAEFDGIADDLPTDLAANLDRYLHGHPRRT